MRNFILLTISGIVIFFIATSHSQGAQNSDLEVFKKQLEIMEETIEKQQEMISDLKDKIELQEKVDQTSITEREESEIERVIDDYLTKDYTREKMVKAGLVPQFNTYWDNGLRFKSEDGNFKLELGGRIFNDWGWLSEDSNVKRAIGDQVDGTEFRKARIHLSGDIYKNIAFEAQYDFAGGEPEFKDVYMELKKIPILGNFRVGQFKPPFSLEELTSSKYITFMERSLPNAFEPGRNTGFMLYNHMLDKRVTWAVNIFRTSDDFGDSQGDRTTEGGYSLAGRITGLPWYKDKGKKLIHTGFSYLYQNAFENEIRFRSRPEMHLADRFVDTGKFDAEYSHIFNPEVSLVYGPFSLQAEYTYVDVELYREMVGDSDPDFSGFYVYGSYFLTGEHRKYKTKKAKFGRVKPLKNFHWGRGKGKGAIELAARYSELDLSDEGIDGGRLQDLTLGINWYLNPNTRVMLNYVRVSVDRLVSGVRLDGDNADLLSMRFQIDF